MSTAIKRTRPVPVPGTGFRFYHFILEPAPAPKVIPVVVPITVVVPPIANPSIAKPVSGPSIDVEATIDLQRVAAQVVRFCKWVRGLFSKIHIVASEKKALADLYENAAKQRRHRLHLEKLAAAKRVKGIALNAMLLILLLWFLFGWTFDDIKAFLKRLFTLKINAMDEAGLTVLAAQMVFYIHFESGLQFWAAFLTMFGLVFLFRSFFSKK